MFFMLILIWILILDKNQITREMGVNKLWDILLTIAVQKHVQDLNGLILAIDASLWIVKVNSIFQNIDEGLKCIFNKILWLKKNNIRPIFVFDGETPSLKRKTIQQRRSKRKQINQLDITKKVQIQIVKAVTGSQTNSQKAQTKSMFKQKSKEIDQMLNNLLKYEQPTNTIDLSEKVVLQAEVLNKKYQLYSQVNPNLLKKYGSMEHFQNLDIQSKEEILDQFQQQDWPIYRKNIRNLKQKMTEEEKIIYDMQIIKQKSKIRQLQDNLYRKVMSKKTENGYEIIQGIYNGKKVVQKRRIKQKTFDQWGYNHGKKDSLNDFKQIFLNKRKNQESEHSSIQQQNEQQPDFIQSLFTRDFTSQKRQSSLGSLEQISKKMSESNASNFRNFNHSNNNTNKNSKEGNNKKGNKKNKQQGKKQSKPSSSEQQSLNEYESWFDVEPKPERQSISKSRPSQQINNDPDNFPDYVMMQELDQQRTSSNNIHLQNMLDILGINYMVAPYEAEAQCAALQQMGLVDGVVTQDSDVFLFGARKVYRGLFQDNIKLYSMKKIQQKLSLTRQKLILFALMLGSDYTDGVKGIGIVNAMQILKVHHDIDGLTRFTDWAKSADVLHDNYENKTDYMLESATSQEQRQFYKLHRKFKNYWHVHPNFPQVHIYNAYLQPAVQSGEQLQNKLKQNRKMHIDALKKIMEQKFKMVTAQIQLNIKILSKPFNKKTQPQITQYIDGAFAKISSKRLQKAIDKRQINH